MVLLIVMLVLAVIFTAAVAIPVMILSSKERKEHNEEHNSYNQITYIKRTNLLWCILSAGVPMLCLLFGTFTKVGANEVGIVYDDRYGITDKHFEEGFHAKSIFEHVTTISTLNRDKYIETAAQTKDGQYADFQIAITYAVEKADAPQFFRATGGDKSSTFDDQLMGLIEKDLQRTTIEEDIFELLSTKLEDTRVKFENYLKTSLKAEYGVTLRFATFKDVDAGADIEEFIKQEATAAKQKEINEKQAEADLIKAQAQAAIQQAEAEAELARAEIEVQIAEQKAAAQKAIAEADAYAIEAAGKAQAEAASAYTKSILSMINSLYCNVNKVEEANITREVETGLITSFVPVDAASEVMSYEDCASTILSIVFYNSWDGVLPTTLTSDSLSAMIGALITNN